MDYIDYVFSYIPIPITEGNPVRELLYSLTEAHKDVDMDSFRKAIDYLDERIRH